MRSVDDVLAPLVGREDDPRISGDIAEIYRQLGRLGDLRAQPTTYRDSKYRERSALRVIEQRTARALRKLKRTEIAA